MSLPFYPFFEFLSGLFFLSFITVPTGFNEEESSLQDEILITSVFRLLARHSFP